MNHADRHQIVLHEIRGAQVQNVQTADRAQFLLRRMQPRHWPGAFRNLGAIAAQVHRVAQAGLLHGLRDPIAISLLVFTGFRRRQHQVCRARTAEGFGERSRIADVGRERFRALAHKGLQSPRVIGRDAGRLQSFVRQGAEAFTANVSDAAALTKAFSGARAAYLMLPPAKSREDQERDSDGIAKAVKESGLRYAVHLSSYGAQVPEGTGPVAGLHSSEQKLSAIGGLNVLHLRAAYFMENNLVAIGMIHGMGVFGNALLPDLKLPMAAIRDVGAYAAQRLLDLDFSGKQTRELLGERDLSMTEVTAVIARGIGKPDLRYEQFPYHQVQQALTQTGFSPRKAEVYIEMFQAINAGVLAAQEPRSPQNSTPTSFEKFVQDVFAAAYHGKALTA